MTSGHHRRQRIVPPATADEDIADGVDALRAAGGGRPAAE
jgi:hypothetical protein